MKYEKPELIEITARVRGESVIDACEGGSSASAGCTTGTTVTTACISGAIPNVTACDVGGNFVE